MTELALARREIRALHGQVSMLSADRDALRARLDAEKALSLRYRQQVRILRMSSSWRVTRPLRMLRRKALQRGEF